MFLHAIPNKLIVFDKEKIVVFDGCYQDFLEKIGWGSEDDVKVSKKESSNNKEIRKLRADIIAEKSKKLKPVENKIKSIENSISEKEKELSDTNTAFEKATQSGIGSTIQELSITITELEVKINTLYEELEAITVVYDNEVKLFDERLNDVRG